jgi:LysR family transcriptional regulator, transcriptional activator of the cysJI operon
MENFRLKVFRTVAELLNFTQAADALHLTQPAVTLQIKALEESLSVKLFDRSSARIALTNAGAVLLRYARMIEDLTSQALTELGQIAGEERGRISLGASTTIAQYILPPIVGSFKASHPHVEVYVYGANTESVISVLMDKRIDLAFVEGPPHRAEVKIQLFMTDEIVAIVHPDDALKFAGAVTSVGDLASRALIFRERGSGTQNVVEQALKRAGLNLRNVKNSMELDSTEAIKCAVEAGLGVGFVSRWALRKERQLGTVAVLDIQGLKIRRDLKMIRLQGPSPTGPLAAFVEFALEYATLVSPQVESKHHKPLSGADKTSTSRAVNRTSQRGKS